MTRLEALKLVCEQARDNLSKRIFYDEEYDLDKEEEALEIIEKMITEEEK